MRLIYMYNLSKSIIIYYNQFAVLLHSVRTTLKMSSFRAAFFTSIPLYTPFEIETAFTDVSIVSFRRPIIYVESIAKTCRIGPYP